MLHFRLIVGASAREGLRWARQYLYALLILSPLLLAFVHRTVLTEERQLEKCLGGDYRAYKKRVRRYL